MAPASPPRLTRLHLALIVTGLAATGFAIGPALRWSFQEDSPRNDFASFYAGGRLVLEGRLFDREAVQREEEQLGVARWQHPLPFKRLPFYALLLAPISRLDYRAAYAVWQLLSFAALLSAILLWRHLGLGLVGAASAWSIPVAHVLIRGQDTLVLLLLISLAALLLRSGRQFASGLVWSVCSIKWHLLLALPVFLARRRLWKCGAGFAAGSAVLLVASFAVAGANWPLEYYRTITAPEVTPHLEQMPNLRGLFHGVPGGPLFEAVGAAVVLVLAWRAASPDRHIDYAVAGLVVSGLLAGHHAYLYDCALLIPALCATIRHAAGAPARNLALLLLTPLAAGTLLFPPWSRLFPAALLVLMFLVGSGCYRPQSGDAVTR